MRNGKSVSAIVPTVLRNSQVNKQIRQKVMWPNILLFKLSRLGSYHRTEQNSWEFRIGGYQRGLLGRGSMCKGIWKVVKGHRERAFSIGHSVCKA